MRAMPDSLPDRPKGTSLKPLRALWPYIARYRGTLVLALGALLLASIAMLSLPVALRNVIDSGLAAENAAVIDRYFLGLLLVAAVFGGFAALRFYLVTWLGERVVADIRSQTFARVIRLDPAYFEITQTGEVLSRSNHRYNAHPVDCRSWYLHYFAFPRQPRGSADHVGC